MSDSKDRPTPSNDAEDPKADSEGLVRTDESGRKWLGDIPYDVFFDDPLATAGDLSRPDASQPVAATAANPPDASPLPDEAAAGTSSEEQGAGFDWGQSVPISVIETEVKMIRNHLRQSLQTVGTYNGSYKEIQCDGATLAAIAAVAIEHPASLSWKDRAPLIRNLGTQISEAADELGREAYDKTQKCYHELVDVLDGGSGGREPSTEARVAFAVCADRIGLMRRMNRSSTWLKQNVGTADELTANADEAAHEASMIAALAAVVSHTSYDSAEDDVYSEQAAAAVDSALAVRKAIEMSDLGQFQDAFNRVQQSCDRCHADYRFGNE